MQRFALFVASVGLCIFLIPGPAQGQAVQLCVAGMQVSGVNESSGVGQEALIKFLKKEKPDKALPTESVTIPSSTPEDALVAAKQKGCDYLVTTNETNAHAVDSWSTGRTAPVNTPTFYVTTAYKLNKVSDGSELSSGSFKASDSSSEQNALSATMKKIADKVTETIKKAGPIAK